MPMDVTCALIEADGRVLVARRAEGAARGGLWEFPGGKVGSGETEAECLVREIREELGVTVALVRRLTPVRHREPDREIRLIPYLCALESGSPRPLEHDQILWSEPRGLVELDWCPADMPVLSQYLRERAPWLAEQMNWPRATDNPSCRKSQIGFEPASRPLR